MDNEDEDKTVEQVVEETPEVVDFDLNIHVARLLMNEPFFAALSRRVDKRPTQGIPTAGVLVNPHTAQFEMLYGIRRDLQEKLRDEGKQIRIYVPYGDNWLPYTMRRLKEWKNLKFVISNVIKELLT